MALKTFVKVSSITNLSDARYCAGMGADMLGFRVIEGQVNFITPPHFQEIRGWITGPKVVAEIYGLKDRAALAQVLENYRPDVLELGLAELAILKDISLPFILSINNNEVVEGSPEYILTQKEFNGYIPASLKRLVAVDTRDDADQTLKQSTVFGIALKGGIELRPGIKEYEDLSEIFEMLETDD